MPATPIRRHRAARMVLLAVASLALLAGCTSQQKDKSNYKDTEEEFVAGCIDQAEADNASGEATTEIGSPKTYCQCVFDTISDEDTGVPFEEFNDINADLRDNGGPLPKKFVKAYADCATEA